MITGRAKRLLDYLWEKAEANDDYIKINNEPSFMPLVVELIGGNCISLAHYGECNGDLMADPEMVFWKNNDNEYMPVFYQNDWCGIYWQSMSANEDNSGLVVVNESMHKDAVSFFNSEWSNNIIWQQNLEEDVI